MTAINTSTDHTATTTASGLIVHLAGDWYNAADSVDLVSAPRLRTDDMGQLWAQVGDEVEHLQSLPLSMIATDDEVFVVSRDDYQPIGIR